MDWGGSAGFTLIHWIIIGEKNLCLATLCDQVSSLWEDNLKIVTNTHYFIGGAANPGENLHKIIINVWKLHFFMKSFTWLEPKSQGFILRLL